MLRPPLIGDCESRAEVATVRKYCSRNTCRVYLSKSDHNVRDYPRCGAQRIRTDEISRGIVPRVLHYIAALVSKFDLGINTKNCEGARHHHPAVVAAARALSDCSPSLDRGIPSFADRLLSRPARVRSGSRLCQNARLAEAERLPRLKHRVSSGRQHEAIR